MSIELPVYDMDKWPATGWDKDVTYNYGNPESMAANADAAHVLSNMNLSNTEQAKMVLAIDGDGRDIEEVVQEWLDANKASWSQWLP